LVEEAPLESVVREEAGIITELVASFRVDNVVELTDTTYRIKKNNNTMTSTMNIILEISITTFYININENNKIEKYYNNAG
jgi:hypothetical protein